MNCKITINYRIFFILTVVVFLVASCTNENRIKNIEDNLKKLQTSDSSLTARIKFLEEWEEISSTLNQRALIDITELESGYQVLKSNVGDFLVSLREVQPYLDGLRIKLNLGNPHYITYNGAKLNVTWNLYKNSKEINITKDLRPGSWNPVEFIITPVSISESKFITVSIQVDRLSLYK